MPIQPNTEGQLRFFRAAVRSAMLFLRKMDSSALAACFFADFLRIFFLGGGSKVWGAVFFFVAVFFVLATEYLLSEKFDCILSHLR